MASIIPYWFLLNRDFPRVFDSAFERACKMIVESKKQWQKKYPKGRFLTYFHPLSYGDEKMKECLKRYNVETLSARQLPFSYKEATLTLDAHPNGRTNKHVAEDIVHWLNGEK